MVVRGGAGWVGGQCRPSAGRARTRTLQPKPEPETPLNPSCQIYTGNHLGAPITGKGGAAYGQWGGFALEAQGFTDFLHHANFPKCVLSPGKEFAYVWQLRFSTDTA